MDLEADEDYGSGDKGTEAGVFGKKGLAELYEFASHGSTKGYAKEDAKAANLKKIRIIIHQ